MWRAGANENTTITFTDPVTIEGQPLAAGTYGLHMIPNERSVDHHLLQDAHRLGKLQLRPEGRCFAGHGEAATTDLHNALVYDFDKVEPDSTVVTMSWDKVAVPFKVAVNLQQTVEASLHNQLRGLSQYTWDAWDDAATYMVDNKMDLNEALQV